MTTSHPHAHPPNTDQTIYQLTFYTPRSHTTSILSALHATTAGTWPNGPNNNGNPTSSSTNPATASASASAPAPKYTNAAFISQGTGQFLPTADATPHIGTPGTVERVDEDKVEMVVVGRDVLRRAVKALRETHPYEVVGFFVVRCLGEDEY